MGRREGGSYKYKEGIERGEDREKERGRGIKKGKQKTERRGRNTEKGEMYSVTEKNRWGEK